MEAFPSDPLEGLDYSENEKGEFQDSLFPEPSWMEASRQYTLEQPTIPKSELGIPHSYSPTKKRKKKKKPNDEANHSFDTRSYPSNGLSSKKYSLPTNKVTDPKAAELLNLCRSGWTLSKGQKNRPNLGKIDLNTIDKDIQSFAGRYSDARSKSSASKGTDLNSIGHRVEPHLWPTQKTIDLKLSTARRGFNPSMFRPAEVKKSTLGNSSFSFPKDIRLHPEAVRSPGPVFDTSRAYEAVLPKHSTPVIGASGRTLAGSIYYDEFNLKSHGNYYHANEAYLNHTTAPSARISTSAILEPKKTEESAVDQRASVVRDSRSPMKALRDIRAGKRPNKGKFS